MPGEIIGEVAVGAVKAVLRFLVEIGFEILVKGTGYLIVRPFSRRADPEGLLVVLVGLAVWMALGGAVWMVVGP